MTARLPAFPVSSPDVRLDVHVSQLTSGLADRSWRGDGTKFVTEVEPSRRTQITETRSSLTASSQSRSFETTAAPDLTLKISGWLAA